MGGDAQVDLKRRTKQFALRVIRLYVALPKTTEAQVIGRQVLKSGTSVGAHYREATRTTIERRIHQQDRRRSSGTG